MVTNNDRTYFVFGFELVVTKKFYNKSKEVEFFNEQKNIQTYMNSQFVPEMASLIKKKIKSGEVKEVKETFEEFKGLLRWED